MQHHLLEKYPESTVNDDRVLNSPEKRLCRAYYQTKHERESLLGKASQYITIEPKGEKFVPVFDSRYQADVAALYTRMKDLDARAEDLKRRINAISEKFSIDIRGLHDEKKRIETSIEKLNMFPDEQDKLRKQHLEIVNQIEEYKQLLADI
jgi:hypothetical protein